VPDDLEDYDPYYDPYPPCQLPPTAKYVICVVASIFSPGLDDAAGPAVAIALKKLGAPPNVAIIAGGVVWVGSIALQCYLIVF
jgi:hypothetical protein